MLAALTFLLLFGPRLQILDLHMATTGLLACYGVLRQLQLGVDARSTLLVVQLPALIYAAAIGALAGAADMTTPWLLIKWMVFLLAGLALADLYERRGGNWEWRILRDVVAAAVINGLFVIAVVTIAPLRAAAGSLLSLDQKGHWIETGFRGFDLSMGGGASAAIVFSVILVALLRHVSLFQHGVLAALSAAVLLAATLLTGRTGLVVFAMGVALLIARAATARMGLLAPSKGNGFAWGFVALVLAVTIALLVSESSVAVHLRDVVLPWALEGLIDAPGAAGNQSVSAIANEMLFLPNSDGALLFGTANAGRSDLLAYVPSDVGYVRLIFAVGLLGLLLICFGLWPIARLAWVQRGSSPLAFCAGFYLFTMLITNFKELHFAPRGGAALLALFAAGLAIRLQRRMQLQGVGVIPPARAGTLAAAASSRQGA
ncbi:MAG: hypothetical protein ACREV5_16145 [Steroidobacter sp.]